MDNRQRMPGIHARQLVELLNSLVSLTGNESPVICKRTLSPADEICIKKQK